MSVEEERPSINVAFNPGYRLGQYSIDDGLKTSMVVCRIKRQRVVKNANRKKGKQWEKVASLRVET